MAYIGPEPNPGQNREVDDISSSFNGSTTAFTLQVSSQNVSPGSANAIIVSLGGVVQNPGTDYTINASTITFTTAPANGLSFFGLVLGQGVDTSQPADGSISTVKIADQAVTLAKLPHGTGSNDGKFLRANNGADPTFETVNTDLVSDTSPQLGGDLDANGNNIAVDGGNNITIGDNGRLRLGASQDLDIYHDGSTNIIDSASANLEIRHGAEKLAAFAQDGQAELYYDGSKKAETISTGLQTVEAIKMTHGGNGVNLKQVQEQGVGNTASMTATVPSVQGGGTVMVTVMHNGNASIKTTKMFPIMINGGGTAGLGSEIFSINGGSAASMSVSAIQDGISVTNNAGAHAKIRVTFDITANV